MKKIWAIGCTLFLLTVFPLLTDASAEKIIELTYNVFYPAQHKHTLLAMEWAKEIEKRTDGRVKITVFPGGTIAPPNKAYQGVITGISDLAFSVCDYTRGRFLLMEGLELPYGIKTSGTKLIMAYYKKFQPEEFNDTKVMYFHGHGPGIIHTREPVRTFEDIKGMKIRCGGGIAEIAKHLGAAPVSMSMGEAYDALSKGVVEGIYAPYEPLEGFNLAEVVNYTTECYDIGYTTVQYIVMNKDKWNALPNDIQTIIEKINDEWVEKTSELWNELDKTAKQFCIQKGHEIISLTKEESERWVNAQRPLFEKYIKNANARGLPAEKAVKFCFDYLENHN
jgi:TRAP-type C4-dicarboxylate transport system substrate-binding protein